MAGGWLADAVAAFLLPRDFLSWGTVTAVGAAVGLAPALPPASVGLGKSSSPELSGPLARATVVTGFDVFLRSAACWPFAFFAGDVSDVDTAVPAGGIFPGVAWDGFPATAFGGGAVVAAAVVVDVAAPSPTALLVRGCVLPAIGGVTAL